MKTTASDQWAATETKALDECQRLSARQMRRLMLPRWLDRGRRLMQRRNGHRDYFCPAIKLGSCHKTWIIPGVRPLKTLTPLRLEVGVTAVLRTHINFGV